MIAAQKFDATAAGKAFNPTFLIAVAILVAALFGMRLITSAWSWAFHKETVPLVRELNTIPRNIGPYQLVRSEVMPPDIERQLGTDKYISYLYRDTRKEPEEAGSAISLHVVYYTGNQEPVSAAHVPEICYEGSGFTRVDVRQVELEVEFQGMRQLPDGAVEAVLQDGSTVRLPGSTIPLREFEFMAPGASETGTVLYFFFYNGRYVAARRDITFHFLDIASRAVYYSKVEVAPGRFVRDVVDREFSSFVPGTDSAEETRRLAAEFMGWLVPEIKGCLPDDALFIDLSSEDVATGAL